MGVGDRKMLRHTFVIFLVYFVCMKKYLFIVLLVGSWSCGGGINIFGNGNGGGLSLIHI